MYLNALAVCSGKWNSPSETIKEDVHKEDTVLPFSTTLGRLYQELNHLDMPINLSLASCASEFCIGGGIGNTRKNIKLHYKDVGLLTNGNKCLKE